MQKGAAGAGGSAGRTRGGRGSRGGKKQLMGGSARALSLSLRLARAATVCSARRAVVLSHSRSHWGVLFRYGTAPCLHWCSTRPVAGRARRRTAAPPALHSAAGWWTHRQGTTGAAPDLRHCHSRSSRGARLPATLAHPHSAPALECTRYCKGTPAYFSHFNTP